MLIFTGVVICGVVVYVMMSNRKKKEEETINSPAGTIALHAGPKDSHRLKAIQAANQLLDGGA